MKKRIIVSFVLAYLLTTKAIKERRSHSYFLFLGVCFFIVMARLVYISILLKSKDEH
ncbi:hypothetical protein EsVE80_07320 [Enterococcus saigonensis]|uniref:Uncharacterized protein n=1 Tax=Enterococcus saigonensis TaxID=1805431 RepID=A0A679IAX5_9ENTE|nr:hypothetical protein EsVE80_07320 [Enterococcus saigonensis]